jgi:SAM-dependent methyltransferase
MERGTEASKTGKQTYSSAIAEARNYTRWLVDTFAPYLHGRIIEVGIGHGSYCQFLSKFGEYLGIDIDNESVREARDRYSGCSFAVCDILDGELLKKTVSNGVDAVVSINVLEHIKDDAAAVRNLVDLLTPGGHLLLAVPAFMVLYNDLDRLAGHHRRYSVKLLGSLLSDQPVEIVRLCYFNPIGGLGWFVNSLKRHHALDSDGVNGQIKFFDRYLISISRAADPLFRSIFGQTVICIAQRR